MRLTSTLRNWLMAVLAVPLGAVALGLPISAADDDGLAGSQGTDTSLPLTDSAMTVNGRGQFADLKITVNQTKNLANQAISITWEGGQPTRAGSGRFSAHYLQFMQCWGEDDGTVSENPGPPPEQCVQGAVAGTYGGIPGVLYPTGFALSRIISRSTWPNFDESIGVLDPRSTNVWRPFRAVDGTVIDSHTDPTFNPSVVGGNFWQNPYFDIVTTNEIAGGVTRPNGTGAELMQVLTGVQSTGLGCGQRVLVVDDSDPQLPKCWLVIVPRGEPSDENVGTPFAINADQTGVATSPVSPTAWANRIAVPLEFSPVDSPCRLGDDERQIAGNELVLSAVASWQPALCGSRQLPPFGYAPIGDPTARRQITSPTVGSPSLVAISQPVDASQISEQNPIVYAPLTASGVAIGFNIERAPQPTAPASAQQVAGVRIADLNLTPRLVAKLLTQSYSLAVQIIDEPDYDWVESNPFHLGVDPEFVQFNPEFAVLRNGDRNFSSLTIPAGNSDAANQVWEWVLSDPEARAWLDGQPDEWGMRVNPVYSTTAAGNSTGFPFGDPTPVSFPKADPHCYRSGPVGALGVVPPPLCGTDWLPYARSFEEAAAMTRAAFDRARVVLNPFAIDASNAWSRSDPQFLGSRTFISMTDTSSAARYGLQTARLSRAGDNGPDRVFVGPTEEGLRAGVGSMKPREHPTFLEPAPLDQPADAYPLTTLTYGAIAPLTLEAEARSDYADFVRYAATDGQTPGTDLGSLPIGYLPLPDLLVDQALTAAESIIALQPPDPAPAPAPAEPIPVPTPAPEPTPAPTPAAPQLPVASSSPASPPAARPPAARPPAASSAATTAPVGEVPESTAPETAEGEEVVADRELEEPSIPSAATPSDSPPASRYAVPVASGMALLSALAALELTKRPRRAPRHDDPAGTLMSIGSA